MERRKSNFIQDFLWIFEFEKKKNKSLTNHLAGRIHLTAAHRRQTPEKHMQLIRIHQTGHISAENLRYHAEQHHTFWTETIN